MGDRTKERDPLDEGLARAVRERALPEPSAESTRRVMTAARRQAPVPVRRPALPWAWASGVAALVLCGVFAWRGTRESVGPAPAPMEPSSAAPNRNATYASSPGTDFNWFAVDYRLGTARAKTFLARRAEGQGLWSVDDDGLDSRISAMRARATRLGGEPVWGSTIAPRGEDAGESEPEPNSRLDARGPESA